MKRLMKVIQRAPKLSGLLAVLGAALVVPLALNAWGPAPGADRPVTDYPTPANEVRFNSMRNTPKHGSELNFVQVRNVTDSGSFGENVDLVPGKEYEVSVYFHNNASEALNKAEYDHRGIALNTRMKVAMPATVAAGAEARIDGSVTADNAKPNKVWDEAYGKNVSNGTVALRYVQNSAKLTNNHWTSGQAISLDQLTKGDGALIGYDKLDGKVPGCFQYAGYVTYRFVVDQPNFEVSKQVSLTGKNDWKESVDTKPGDKVDFRIHYKNTGTMVQENVSIRDDLPKHLTLVDGTAKFFNAKTNGQWQAISNQSAIVGNGVDFGAFGAGGGMYVAFTARVADAKDLVCGPQTLINRAVVTTSNGTKTDNAQVVVTKECEEPEPEKVKVCDLNDKTIRTITKEEFEANKDRYTTDLDKCKDEPTTKPEKVEVCDPDTGKIIKVDEDKADQYLPVDSEECKDKPAPEPEKVKVCDLDKMIVRTVTKEQIEAYPERYTTDVAKCDKEEEPKEGDAIVCNPETGKVITVKESERGKYLPKDSEECKEKPVVEGEVTELPQTGFASVLTNVLGLGALTTAGYYYITSRRV